MKSGTMYPKKNLTPFKSQIMKNELTLKNDKNHLQIFNQTQLVTKYNPNNLQKLTKNVKTIEKAMMCDVQISLHKKNTDENVVKELIKLHLTDINDKLKVHQKLTEEDIEDLANEILTDYYFLSFVEIQFVLKDVRRGKYGAIDYSLNYADVLSWFEKYSIKRTKCSVNQNLELQKLHRNGKYIENGKIKSTDNILFSDVQIDMLKNVTKDVKEKLNTEDFKQWKKENL